MFRTLIASILAVGAVAFAAPAPVHADPACVAPDGGPCAPAPQGCVQADNSLPCSSSLPDINAAIKKELDILGIGR
ncbi:hypothetical protein [Mycobacterium sp.]|uniref:hypothetical protein n=1 Tax=Mycobacterium sp. TaxID=1785 RepID=UPI003F98D2A8